MHAYSEEIFNSPEQLTPAVLQVAEMLGMYRAELARILHLQCSDIGNLANARQLIVPDSITWQRAVLFMRFYQALYTRLAGDEVAMCHWLRAHNDELQGQPLVMMVDHDRLAQVLRYLAN